ncbi:MAG: PAS domain S-box protein [Pseudomonadota bacterium]
MTQQELIEENAILKQKIKQLENSEADLKQKQAELHESEERFCCLAASAWEGIIIHRECIILDANEAILKMIGCRAEDVIGQSIVDFFEPESIKPVLEKLRVGINKKDFHSHFETLGLKKDKTVFPVEVMGKPIRYKNRDARVVAMRDITERKLAETEEVKLATAIEQVSATVMLLSTEGIIQYVNKAVEKLREKTREELKGRNIFDNRQLSDQLTKIWRIVSTGETWSGVITERMSDGNHQSLEFTITPVRDAQGTIESFISIGRDVNHELRLEELQRKSQN